MILSKSITKRAANIMITGVEPLEAVKQAINEENKLINEMINQTTDRSKKALTIICKNVYLATNSINY